MKKTISPEEATDRLETLCSRSEQSTFDIRQKLYRWGIADSEAEKITRHLIAYHFVDDARFARAYVRDKYRFASWGRNKIRAGLYSKRISRDIIDSALSEIDSREYQLKAFAAIRTKARSLNADAADLEICRKLLRFAIGRGYESALILRILHSKSLWAQ